MKLVRKNTFETNSSSTHAIVIPRKGAFIQDKIVFQPGEYGWEWDTYDFHNYLWTAIMQMSEYYDDCSPSVDEWKTKIKEVLFPYCKNIVFVEPSKDEYGFSNCYIDHCGELIDLLNRLYEDENLLLDAIMNGVVYTGNDNSESELIVDVNDDDFYYEKGN